MSAAAVVGVGLGTLVTGGSAAAHHNPPGYACTVTANRGQVNVRSSPELGNNIVSAIGANVTVWAQCSVKTDGGAYGTQCSTASPPSTQNNTYWVRVQHGWVAWKCLSGPNSAH